MKKNLLLILIFCSLEISIAQTQTDSISYFGFTFYFLQNYTVGQFANGDYWALDPGSGVIIDSITPSMQRIQIGDSLRWVHGWEVNPVFEGKQGFDERGGWRSATSGKSEFDINLVPALPYTAKGGESILKCLSYNLGNLYDRTLIKRAVVLTILSSLPPDGTGEGYFRPPYVGTNKPFYKIEDIHFELLPQVDPVSPMPVTLDSVIKWMQPVQADHKAGLIGNQIRPVDNIGSDYGPSVAKRSTDSYLRVMVKAPGDNEEKRRLALICLLQKGLDMYHYMLYGQTWPGGNGHEPGHVLPVSFTAIMMNHDGLKTFIRDSITFHESQLLKKNIYGKSVYGTTEYLTEEKYWNTLAIQGDNSSYLDPYSYIDGGYMPGWNYQGDCVSSPWLAEAIAFKLFPQMKDAYNDSNFFDYTDRWYAVGALTQPDPIAPAPLLTKEQWNNRTEYGYGVTWGPDPAHPGKAILDQEPSDGLGRFPNLHAKKTNIQVYITRFQKAMWDAYRGYGDEQLPTKPTGLQADEIGERYVKLNWNSSSDDIGVIGYYVYRDSSGVCVDTLITVVNECADAPVSPSTTYEYRVAAFDLAGKISELSDTITVKTKSPSGLRQETAHPRQFNLYQNYPNPFNPNTQIKYELPERANVRLTVYNIVGQEIAVLVNEQQNSGTYTIGFDANKFSSGVYFYKLEAGNKASVKSMILLK